MKKERMFYPDAIRTLSCIFVIIIHISGSSAWYTLNVKENAWAILMFYNACVRSAVPLFVMISGVFLLDSSKKCEGKYLGGKIIHLLKIYIVWSIFYGIVYGIENPQIFQGQNVLNILKSIGTYILESKYHLWFIPMLIGIYFLVPCIRKIAESKRMTEYFLCLFICFNILRGFFVSVIKNDMICSVINRIPMEFVMGFAGYFLLGYYISKWGLSKKVKVLCGTSAIVMVLGSAMGSIYFSRVNGSPEGMWTDEFSISSFFAAVAIFSLIKDWGNNRKEGFVVLFIKFVAKHSLGIYLVHVFWIELLEKLGFTVNIFNTIVSVPVLTVIVFGISLLTCYLLEKIRIIQKIIF